MAVRLGDCDNETQMGPHQRLARKFELVARLADLAGGGPELRRSQAHALLDCGSFVQERADVIRALTRRRLADVNARCGKVAQTFDSA